MSYKKIIISLIITGIFFFSVSLYFFQQNYQKQQKKPTTQNTETTQPSTPPNNHYLFKSKGGHFDTYFPQNVLDINSDIKVEKDESSISFSLLSSSDKTITGQMINKTQVLYPKISQTGNAYIDLRYSVSGDQISEEFILNQKQTFPVFKQKINLFNAFVANYSKSIQFNHPGTNKLLWYIPTPFMYEQNNPTTKHDGVKFTLNCDQPNIPLKDCRTLILTKEITPEGQKWLNDPNRNYPVIIDPTVKDNCWGLNDLCDQNCLYSSLIGATTVYATCTATDCTSACWGFDDVCKPTLCIYTQTLTYTYSNQASPCSNNGQCYVANDESGYPDCETPPNNDGTNDDCFYNKGNLWNKYKTYSSCGAFSCYSQIGNCIWYAAKKQYNVSNPVTRYSSASGGCVPGSGSCYSITWDGIFFYSGNTPCGSSNCTVVPDVLFTATTCAWYGELGGDSLMFEGVMLESLLIN